MTWRFTTLNTVLYETASGLLLIIRCLKQNRLELKKKSQKY